MRFLHTSDWHLGRRLHGAELLGEQATFLAWLLETATCEQVDAVLVSGDVYDRAQPGADAIALMDRTLAAFARARIPLIISSGNHDSAVRLQYAGEVLAEAGIHLRTSVEQVTDPVLLSDRSGQVGVYGIPFVLPDAVVAQLDVQRSHAAVLGELAERIRSDAAERGLTRVVVMAHAFVTGGSACESEREIRVGGVGDTPAEVFDGVSYVALGHLHGPQEVRLTGSSTVVAYSGSPLAFSFSERDHTKSVTIVDIDAAGEASTRRVPAPVPRPLVQVTGRLADLLERAQGDLDGLAEAWVKVVLTDPGRLANPMEQLRAHWPHTLVLEFAPERDDVPLGLTRMTEASDPVEICAEFVSAVSGGPPSPVQSAVLAEVVLAGHRVEASA
jgi:DNA repair protein SbcD/Mre11